MAAVSNRDWDSWSGRERLTPHSVFKRERQLLFFNQRPGLNSTADASLNRQVNRFGAFRSDTVGASAR
jgi:hypothetical protein